MSEFELQNVVLTCDIGGTKVATAAVHGENVLTHETIKTPDNPTKLLEKVGDSMVRLSETFNTKIAAIGVNGPAQYRNRRWQVGPLYRITPHTFDLAEMLGAVVPDTRGMKILGLNDAEAAAYDSPRYVPGGVKPGEVVMYINQGTGVGGDSICDEVSMRQMGLLSEYGEVPLQRDGRWTTWGSLISGEGIAKEYGHIDCDGQVLRGAKELYEDYEDPRTTEVWNMVGRDFAKGLFTLLSIVGPKYVVIGGSVAQCHPRYHASLCKELDRMLAVLSSDSATTRPEKIIYVPQEDLATITLRGACRALRARERQLVTV